MDLTGIEGLTPEQVEAINSLHQTDVNGLKDKNAELLGKMDTFKGELSAKEQAIEDARKVAADAEIKVLESQGKYEEALSLREKERAELVGKAETETNRVKDLLKQRDLGDIKSSILAGVQESLRPAADAMLNSIANVAYDEAGKALVSIKYADKEFSNTADFMEFAKTDSTWSALLGAPNTQGFDVNNSNAQGAGNASRKTMKADDKAAYIEKHGQDAYLKLPK